MSIDCLSLSLFLLLDLTLIHIVTNIVYLSVLTVLSGVATLIQAFFQISLATSYKNELTPGCEFILLM